MALGVDLGGSSIKVVALDAGEIRPLARSPHRARGLDELVDALAVAIPHTDRPIGLAVAGLVRGGVVARSGNLGLVDAPLVAALEARLGVRLAAFVSDARAVGRAALQEERSEALLIALALGTGVGGSIIERGVIVRDEGLGHGVTVPGRADFPCAVGHPSCLEAHLGAAALARRGGASSVEELHLRAERGDATARSLLEGAGALAARSMAALADGKPCALVLSGGVAATHHLVAGARRASPGAVVASRFGTFTAAAGAALAASDAVLPGT